MQRRYGLVKSWADERDYQFSALSGGYKVVHPQQEVTHEVETPPPPDEFSLAEYRNAPRDQAYLGSCWGFASTNSVNTLLNSIRYPWKFVGSALFVYYNTRLLMGTVDSDSGSDIRTGFQALNQYGICPEDSNPGWDWNYEDYQRKYVERPHEACYKDAKLHKALKYMWVQQDRESIKAALSAGFTIVGGIQVHKSFESEQVAITGVVPMPHRFDPTLGGHAISIDGYSTNKDRVLCFNSWGADWGDRGGFSLPMDYVCSAKLCSDLVAIQLIGYES